MLSDGQYYSSFAMLASSLNHLIHELEPFTVIKVNIKKNFPLQNCYKRKGLEFAPNMKNEISRSHTKKYLVFAPNHFL